MSEFITSKQTSLDPLLTIPAERLSGEVADPSLEEIAASINANYAVVIGPKNEQLDGIELLNVQRMVDGQDSIDYARIIAGRPGLPTVDATKSNESPDVFAAHVLDILSDYAPDLADSLVGPLSRELMIKRLATADTAVAKVRNLDDIKAFAQRLKIYAKEEQENPYYEKLLDGLIASYDSFRAESDAVYRSTARSRLEMRPKETRKRRVLFRAAGVACLAFSGAMLASGLELPSRNGTAANEISGEANAAVSLMQDISDIRLTDFNLSGGQLKAMTTTEDIGLEDSISNISRSADKPGIQPSQLKTSEQIVSLLRGAIKPKNQSIIGQTNLEEKIDQKAIDLESMQGKDLLLVILDGVILGYLGLGAAAFIKASGNGGRRDKALKAYRQGRLLDTDRTPSTAVNSMLHLGRKLMLINTDESDILS